MSTANIDKIRQSFQRERTVGREGKGYDKFEQLETTDDDKGEPMISQGGIKRDGLTVFNIFCYSVGHVYNDF